MWHSAPTSRSPLSTNEEVDSEQGVAHRHSDITFTFREHGGVWRTLQNSTVAHKRLWRSYALMTSGAHMLGTRPDQHLQKPRSSCMTVFSEHLFCVVCCPLVLPVVLTEHAHAHRSTGVWARMRLSKINAAINVLLGELIRLKSQICNTEESAVGVGSHVIYSLFSQTLKHSLQSTTTSNFSS